MIVTLLLGRLVAQAPGAARAAQLLGLDSG
jgi:hypothetical protein